MASRIIDDILDHRVDIPCPKCGHKTPVSVRQLETDGSLVCGSCRETISLTRESHIEIQRLRKSAEKVQKALDDLGRKPSRLRKKGFWPAFD
jgi:transcription elongation factor Elf1